MKIARTIRTIATGVLDAGLAIADYVRRRRNPPVNADQELADRLRQSEAEKAREQVRRGRADDVD